VKRKIALILNIVFHHRSVLAIIAHLKVRRFPENE